MRPDPNTAQAWVARAESSLALARMRGEGIDLGDLGIEIPQAVDTASRLTRYAVETRYPGLFDPVTVSEHQEALTMAETILAWSKTSS
jgi:hypothetical protein